MSHIDEERLAAFAAGLLTEPERNEVASHLQTCAECRPLAEEYREMVGGIRMWAQVPAEVVDDGLRPLVQRARLHRLLGQLLADPSMRHQAAQNPERLLAAHGVTPTPQLLAAFKELDISRLERFSGALDERITKLMNSME